MVSFKMSIRVVSERLIIQVFIVRDLYPSWLRPLLSGEDKLAITNIM